MLSHTGWETETDSLSLKRSVKRVPIRCIFACIHAFSKPRLYISVKYLKLEYCVLTMQGCWNAKIASLNSQRSILKRFNLNPFQLNLILAD